MTSPTKPWEQGRVLQSSAPMLQGISGPSSSSSRTRPGPPPLPPRPTTISTNTSYMTSPHRSMGMGYNPYESNYGGFGGGYGGYRGGMYGTHGGFYGNTGYGFGPESRFIQLAEDSTRPAFQGIESLVRAFGGVAMMLDSTYFAVHSSFRAVLGVAENFGRIRTLFGQLWSKFALLRFLNWCYRKAMSVFGIKVTEDMGRVAWNEAVREAGTDPNQCTSSWPILVFLGMIVFAPYLISKLLPPMIDRRDPKNWSSPGKVARAVYPFQSSNHQELNLMPGDKILVAPMDIQQEMKLISTGWVFAHSDRGSGIVPINYVSPISSSRKKEVFNGTPAAPASEPKTGEFVNYGQHFNESSSQNEDIKNSEN